MPKIVNVIFFVFGMIILVSGTIVLVFKNMFLIVCGSKKKTINAKDKYGKIPI